MARNLYTNMDEQEDVPGRQDLGPALGSLFKKAPGALTEFVKQNALGGLFKQQREDKLSPSQMYQQGMMSMTNVDAPPMTPEQQTEFSTRALDMVNPMAGTTIGVASVSGKKLLAILDDVVHGADEAFRHAPRLKAKLADRTIEPIELSRLAKYVRTIDKVKAHPTAGSILKDSGFVEMPQVGGALGKWESDQATHFSPDMLKRIRQSRLEGGPEVEDMLFRDGVKNSVIEREYPDQVDQLKINFKDFGMNEGGWKGSITDARQLNNGGDASVKVNTRPWYRGTQTEIDPIANPEAWERQLLSTGAVHEVGGHAVQGIEGWLSPGWRSDGRLDAYNFLKYLPEEDVEKLTPTFKKMRRNIDLGMEPQEVMYAMQTPEFMARSEQAAFENPKLGGTVAGLLPEGHQVLPASVLPNTGVPLHEWSATPTLRDFNRLHKAAGIPGVTPARGREWFFNQIDNME